MASLNKVMLIGNLTRDPEVRYTPKGSAVADIAIAVNRVYTAENNEKREEVTYVDVVLWARLAELAGQYLHKGSPIFVEGRLQMDSWEDKQTGQKRSRLRVVGENMQFLGGAREGGGQGRVGGGDEASFNSGAASGGYSGGGGGGYSGGGGGDGGPSGGGGRNYNNGPSSNQRPPARPSGGQRPAPSGRPPGGSDEFGEGPITDGLDDDDIPF